MYKSIEGDLFNKVKASSDNVYKAKQVGDCWSVLEYAGKYYMKYLSGELGGKLKIIEISFSDYQDACTGRFNQDQLSIKFNVQ